MLSINKLSSKILYDILVAKKKKNYHTLHRENVVKTIRYKLSRIQSCYLLNPNK